MQAHAVFLNQCGNQCFLLHNLSVYRLKFNILALEALSANFGELALNVELSELQPLLLPLLSLAPEKHHHDTGVSCSNEATREARSSDLPHEGPTSEISSKHGRAKQPVGGKLLSLISILPLKVGPSTLDRFDLD